MTEFHNQEELNKALNIYRGAMCDFIFEYLRRRVQGETVEDLIRRIVNRKPSNLEPKHISQIFRDRECRNLFKQRFGHDSQRDRDKYDIESVTALITMGRNRVHHHVGTTDLDSEFTRACLFLIADVLEKINNPVARRKVEEIRDRLFSDEGETHPAEAENTDLNQRLEEMSNQLAAVKIEKADCEKHYETKLKKLESDKAEYEELLDAMEKENAELKERLSETENRPKVIELESDEHVKTLTDKTELEERHETTSIKEWRRKIWKQLCDYAAQKDTPVRFHKPSSENYLNVSRGLIDITGFRMNVWLGTDNTEIALRLYMSKQDFYNLEKQRTEIEQEFCESLEWEKLPQRIESRISLRKDIIDPTDESDWQNQHEWVISKLEKFHKKFNEVFLPRIQELNTSDLLSEDEEDLPLNLATSNSVTFQGTTFTKRLNKYRVEGDEITQTFWHYWHSQGREGKQEMRDAGWSVEKINDDWEVTISPEDFEAWIANEVTELNNLLNPSRNEGPSTQPLREAFDDDTKPTLVKKTSLPTGREMEQPALEFLSDGREYPRIEIINVLTEHFSLTKNQREQLSRSGRVELYLRNKDLIERTRKGYYQITDLGLEVLRRNVDDVPF